jgi:hypothetical protein
MIPAPTRRPLTMVWCPSSPAVRRPRWTRPSIDDPTDPGAEGSADHRTPRPRLAKPASPNARASLMSATVIIWRRPVPRPTSIPVARFTMNRVRPVAGSYSPALTPTLDGRHRSIAAREARDPPHDRRPVGRRRRDHPAENARPSVHARSPTTSGLPSGRSRGVAILQSPAGPERLRRSSATDLGHAGDRSSFVYVVSPGIEIERPTA